jgi:hypothetical protein
MCLYTAVSSAMLVYVGIVVVLIHSIDQGRIDVFRGETQLSDWL